MNPLSLVETSPGKFSLLMDAGSTGVDRVVEGLGHVPHGYFWAAIAKLIIDTEAPGLKGRFGFDPEAGTFCAYGTDEPALTELQALMATAATDSARIRKLVTLAVDKGVDLDD